MTTESTDSPRSLGRYELVHLLGQGGMGEVYLAKISGAAGFEKPCIVKTILPTLLKDRQFLDRFHHEAKVLVHLVHSSIAQVYDMGEAHGTYYMALEYVAGVDVAYLAEQARAQGRAIPVPVALYIGQKVAEGLGYAHRKAGPDGTPLGIVHRDVSPHNVMVSYEGEVKVIDFGLAKSAARSKYTLPSTVMGKLGYMSPEQARAEPVDHRSDIYSCGVMVWELLAGQPLVPHGTVGEMMAAMGNPRVPSLHELRPEVEPAIDAVVRRALAPNPQDRYGRSDEFARALNEQLLRSSASLGAEEVGNFVKGLCPEAFSAQRKLISRISGVGRVQSTPPASGGVGLVGVSPLPAGADPRVELEATSLRPLSEMQQEASLGATLRPMATPMPGAIVPAPMASPVSRQELAPAPAPVVAARSGAVAPAPRLSRSIIVGAVLGLLVLMIGTAVATAHFMGDRSPPPPPHSGGPMPFEPGGPPPPGGPHAGLPPRHGGGPHPPGPPPHEQPPPHGAPPEELPRGAAVAAEAPSGEPAPETVPAAGSEGSVAAAHTVGKEGAGSVAPAVATVQGTRVEPPEASTEEEPAGQAAAPSKAQAGQPRSRESKAATALPPIKGLIAVEQLKGGYFAIGSGVAQLRKGMVVKVVGPKPNGKLKVIGSATVLDKGARGRRAKLDMDDAARAAQEQLFLVMPDGAPELAQAVEPPPEPVPPVSAPPPPPQPKVLDLFVRLAGTIDKEYVIDNRESTVLSRCTATLTGKKWSEIKSLKTGPNHVDAGSFKLKLTVPNVAKGRMLIECAEGVAEVGIRG
ncbi:serine/threonine protein kinase [Hyalangium gracile]|uniref:serine/threonine protein kinase n=1 Tax=Hyalangium gracile TaxID=394092 RepID=UPI001CD02FAE|nr:serine/threonine-protein kinase [Hyalangium gracile]